MGTIIKEYEVASRKRSDLELNEAAVALKRQVQTEPYNDELWMKLGLAYADQKLYRDACDAYSMAIAINPFCGIYHRHRAHRYLSCWRFEDACADFVTASRLIPENWDVWYHLGLSYFLLNDYEKAAEAYQQCYDLSYDDGSLIAVTDWYWITLNRIGRKEEAAALLDRIHDDMDYGDNYAYFQRLRMYQGKLQPDELMPADLTTATSLNVITMGFGLANYYRELDNQDKYKEILHLVLEKGKDDMYMAFAYLASMVDADALGISY